MLVALLASTVRAFRTWLEKPRAGDAALVDDNRGSGNLALPIWTEAVNDVRALVPALAGASGMRSAEHSDGGANPLVCLATLDYAPEANVQLEPIALISLETAPPERNQAPRGPALREAVVRYLPNAVFTTDEDGLVTSYNFAAEELLGYTADEIVDLATPMKWHDSDEIAARSDVIEGAIGVVASGFEVFKQYWNVDVPSQREWTYIHKNGKRIAVEVYITALFDDNAAFCGYLFVINDLEQATPPESDRLANAMSNAVEGISKVDPQGRFVSVNGIYASTAGYLPEELTGVNWARLIHPGDIQLMQGAYANMLREGRAHVELRGLKKDGSTYEQELILVSDLDETGSLTAFHCFMKDITERKTIEREEAEYQSARAALSELRNLDRLKSEFLATASHEMRTPLTVIRQFACVLDSEVSGPINADQHGQLQTVLRNCDRLTGLLDNLLDLEKMQRGHIRVRRTELDVATLLRQCVEDFRPKCETKKQELSIDIAGELQQGLGDSPLIIQAVVNLLGNAHKFTPAQGAITVRAAQVDQTLQIVVEDTGPGIRKEYLKQIFDAFCQVDRVDGPGVKGTGLGLTITKRIMALHDGDVWAESTVGEGSRFFLQIPVWSREAALRAFVEDRRQEAEQNDTECWALVVREASADDEGAALIAAAERIETHVGPHNEGFCDPRQGLALFVLAAPVAEASDTVQTIAALIDPMKGLDVFALPLIEPFEPEQLENKHRRIT